MIRQEARYRLKQGKGIKVFSRPERLHDLLESWGLSVADRASCIVDAGQTVPGFYKEGPDKAEFFVHSPFAWRLNDREIEDRNQDSIVMQVTFVEGGVETYGILGSDADYDTLTKIVETTKLHKREARLLWDFLKLFHHCSYLSLGPERGKDETEVVPEGNGCSRLKAAKVALSSRPATPSLKRAPRRTRACSRRIARPPTITAGW